MFYFIISAFFAYKLYSSLREKDRIKAEKKAAKQQRKEKENKTKVSSEVLPVYSFFQFCLNEIPERNFLFNDECSSFQVKKK